MKRSKKIVIFLLVFVVLLAAIGAIFISGFQKNLDRLMDAPIEGVDLSAVPDGTYEGGYRALPIEVKVRVTVQASRIIKIDLLKHVNGQGGAAEVIPEQVVEAQSLQIDAVSGATYSSKAILLAIENALKSGGES